MKASELRIGNIITIDNYVYWPKLKDIPLIVTNIGSNIVSYKFTAKLMY